MLAFSLRILQCVDSQPNQLVYFNNSSPFEGVVLTLILMPRRGMRIKVRGNKKISSKSSAKKLRSNATDAEVKLWSALKNRQLENFKFRRQTPVGKYIVDFICHKKI